MVSQRPTLGKVFSGILQHSSPIWMGIETNLKSCCISVCLKLFAIEICVCVRVITA